MTLKRILKALYAHGFILDKINADLNFVFTKEDIDRAIRRWNIANSIVSAFFDLPIAILAINLFILRENVIVLSSVIAVLVVLYVIAILRIPKIFSARFLLKIYNERSVLIKKAMNNRSSSSYTNQ